MALTLLSVDPPLACSFSTFLLTASSLHFLEAAPQFSGAHPLLAGGQFSPKLSISHKAFFVCVIGRFLREREEKRISSGVGRPRVRALRCAMVLSVW